MKKQSKDFSKMTFYGDYDGDGRKDKISKKQMENRYQNSKDEDVKYFSKMWKDVKGKSAYGQVDGISVFAVRGDKDGVKLLFRQYMTSVTGHHLARLGYCVTEMKLNKDHTWSDSKGYFLFNN